MSVLFNATVIHRGQVVVDNMHDIANVNAAGRDSGSNENWGPTTSEGSHCRFSLNLSPVTVNGSDWKFHVVEKIVERVGSLAAIDEDDGTNTIHLFEQSKEKLVLLLSSGLNDNLLDVLRSASCSTNSEAHMSRRQVLLGESASGPREGGRKKAISDIAIILLCMKHPLVNYRNNAKPGGESTYLHQRE